MNSNLKNLLQKEMSRKDFLRLGAIATISIIGFGGVLSELLSHAATPYASGEAEDGKLTGSATVGNDTTASGGEFVKFGSSGSTPGAPTAVVATAGNASASLTWTAPSSTGSSAIISYIVTPYLNGSAQSPISTSSALTSYTVSNLTNGDSYTFTVAATNSTGTGSASSQSSAVTPVTGATTSSTPTPMMSEYSKYVLAENGDFEFAQMPSSTGKVPSDLWVNSPDGQQVTPTTLANVSIVNGTGLVLQMANDNSGACIDTNPLTHSPGFSCPIPFYREVEASFSINGGYIANWPASWALGNLNGAAADLEVDINEGLSTDGADSYNGQVQGHLHAPGDGAPNGYQSTGIVMGALTGTHKYGVYVTTTGVTWYLDGEQVPSSEGANPQPWPSSSDGGSQTISADVEFYALEAIQWGEWGGPFVQGADGAYTVAYDRFFVPS